MVNYGITRVEKRKKWDVAGIQMEANRDRERDHENKHIEFYLSDIDWKRTDDNIYLKKTNKWNAYINNVLEQKGINGHRKDAIVMLDGLYTASPEFFENKTKDEMINFFKDCYDFHVKNYCSGDESLMINAVIHLDETTPHMQLASVPIIHDKDKNKNRLSAKDVMGNRKEYRQRQDEFFKDIGQKWQLERGEKSDPKAKREHKEKLEYEVEKLAKKSDELNVSIKAKMKAFENAKSQMEKLTQRLDQSIKKINESNKNHSSIAGMGKVIVDEKVFNELVKYSEIEKTLSDSLNEIFSEINQQNRNIIATQKMINTSEKMTEDIYRIKNNANYKKMDKKVKDLEIQESYLTIEIEKLETKQDKLINETNGLYDQKKQHNDIQNMINFANDNKGLYSEYLSEKEKERPSNFFDDIEI